MNTECCIPGTSAGLADVSAVEDVRLLIALPPLRAEGRGVQSEEPDPVAPVRLRGWMAPSGYKAENAAWKPFLTCPDRRLGMRADGSSRLAGRDPMKLSLETLRKSGHPNRRTAALVSALGNPHGLTLENADGDPLEALSDVRAYRDISAYCNACAGSAHLRRKCAVIDCPFWAYRTGRNPHSPRRGIRPTFGPVSAKIRPEDGCPQAYLGRQRFKPYHDADGASASLQLRQHDPGLWPQQ